jgi:hypothetical protein
MDHLTPVILFGAAAIAGHAWGDALLERLHIRAAVAARLERVAERIAALLGLR